MKFKIGLVMISGVFLASCGVFNVNVQVHPANQLPSETRAGTNTPSPSDQPDHTILFPESDYTPSALYQPSSFKLMDFVAVCPAVGEICVGYVWIQNIGSLYPASRFSEIMHPPTYTICIYEGNETCLGMVKDNWRGDFRRDADYNLSWDTAHMLTGPDYILRTEIRIQHAGVYRFSLHLFDEFPGLDTWREYGTEIASRIVLVTVK